VKVEFEGGKCPLLSTFSKFDYFGHLRRRHGKGIVYTQHRIQRDRETPILPIYTVVVAPWVVPELYPGEKLEKFKVPIWEILTKCFSSQSQGS
jgi:hypothetical protein